MAVRMKLGCAVNRHAKSCLYIQQTSTRGLCSEQTSQSMKHYQLLVVGGGAGGCSVAARACRSKKFESGKVAVVEPAKYHYYQPMWTLVGAGIKSAEQSRRLMADVLPSGCDHVKQSVLGFEPDKNRVTLSNGEQLCYDFLVIALGIKVDFNKVEGLVDALKFDHMVCSNYDIDTVSRTFFSMSSFGGGNALFTFPNTPIKCPGAPQKIMYLMEDFWSKTDVRERSKISFHTAMPVIFSAPKYAEKLMSIVKKRDISVYFRRSLKAIDHQKKTALFDLLDQPGETETCKYDLIHVTPPQSAPDALGNSSELLTDATGFLDVNRHTLQHTRFHNIFGIGDCTNLPTPRTAAAVAAQNPVLFEGLLEVMDGKEPTGNYEGYTSCPLVTSSSKVIMAEFDYTLRPVETLPFDQRVERRSMFYLKSHVLPRIYWNRLLKGKWPGPAYYRKKLQILRRKPKPEKAEETVST